MRRTGWGLWRFSNARAWLAMCGVLAGCPGSEPGSKAQKAEVVPAPNSNPSKPAQNADGPAAACDNGPAPSVDKLDLLFVIDDSMSMREEQQALREQFPRLLTILTSGDRDQDGSEDFAPFTSVHLGVVSTDLGVANVSSPEILGCSAIGDDGRLLQGRTAGGSSCGPGAECSTDCGAAPAGFLEFRAGDDAAEDVASKLACIADIGTSGCGFEQQLESALKALWPSQGEAPKGGAFLADDAFESSAHGHGDLENEGFVRQDAEGSRSVVAIVMVTDEEDCSSRDTRHFTRNEDLAPNDPLSSQPDLNLRCFNNKQNLFPVDRYVDSFKALRPGNEQLVVFAAFVGVPPDLVSTRALADVDLADATARDAYYDSLLEDPRMLETIDPNSVEIAGKGNLTPSCETSTGTAYPPRRIVSVAKSLGQNSLIHSLCDGNLAPAVDALVGRIAHAASQPSSACTKR